MNNLKEKIELNFNKNKKYILAFLVIWVAIVSITCYAFKDTLGKESYGNSVYDQIIYFNNKEVVQNVDTIDGSKTISLFLSIQNKTGSNINVKVVGNDSETVYGDVSIKDRNVLNDSYNAVVLDYPLDLKKDKTINIVINSENETYDNLGIWYSNNNYFGDDRLIINGEIIKGSITAKFLCDNDLFLSFNNYVLTFVIIGGILIILYYFIFEPKKEKLFSLLALFLGIAFMIIITPISGPDEDYHYKQTLILSNEMLGKENVLQIEDTYIDYEGFTSQTNNGRAYKRIMEIFNSSLDDLSTRNIVDIERSTVYSYTLCYVPQALGITIARLCKFNYLNTYYAGRFFGLLFYVFCVYVAIKNTPILKNMFGIVSIFPMFVQQAITYTQDAWICALSMVIFSFVLKWKFSETKIDKKDFIFALIVVLLLAPAKYVYSLFAATFFIVSNKNVISKKTKIILVTLLAIPMIYVIGSNIVNRIMPIINNPILIDGNTGLPMTEEEMLEMNPNFSIRYILAHPQAAILITMNTIKTRLKTWVCTAVARALSGGTLLIPLEIVYGFMALSIVAAMQKEEYILSIGNKIYIVVICLAIAALIMASMLVGWTKYYDDIIQGLQGRYFSPMIVYLLPILNNKKIQLPQSIDKYLLLAELVLSFMTIINVLSFTFVN